LRWPSPPSQPLPPLIEGRRRDALLAAELRDRLLRLLKPSYPSLPFTHFSGIQRTSHSYLQLKGMGNRTNPLNLTGASRMVLEGAHSERAERQYHAGDPDNRLVARTLEARWAETLRNVRTLPDG